MTRMRWFWMAACLAFPAPAWAGATVWIPNRAVSVAADAVFVPAVPGEYGAENAIDTDPKTTFVVKRGEVLRIDLGGTPRIHYVQLMPGYAKSDKVWRSNRRVTKVRVRTKLKSEVRPWKTAEFDPPDTLGSDEPWFGVAFERQPADTVEIEVLASEASKDKRSDDVCISEVILLTMDNQPSPTGPFNYDEGRSPDRDAMPFERFDLTKTKCTNLEHDNTGGARTVFVGACSVQAGVMRLKGNLEVREPDGVERTRFEKTFGVRRINSRIVIVDRHFYRR